MSTQNNNKKDFDNKQYFLDVWREMLQAILEWPEGKVEQWVQVRQASLPDEQDDIFYHKEPQYWITRYLVPDSLKTRLSDKEIHRIQRRMYHVLVTKPLSYPPLGFDWKPYKQKVQEILQEYGQELPS